MPTLRIYYNSFFDTKLENIENKTEKHLINIEDKTVTAYLKSGKKTVIYEHGMFKY